MTNSVLFVDDDGELVFSLIRALKSAGLKSDLHAATSASRAIEIQNEREPQVVVLDLCLDKSGRVESGFSLLSQMMQLNPSMRVIVLTGHSSIEHGVRAMELGAAHFLEKPANVDHLKALIVDSEKQIEIRHALDLASRPSEARLQKLLLGRSPKILELHKKILFAAATPQAVLVTGETGTGKGVCARAIHELSSRRAEPFIRFQPAFISGEILHSELFGHVRGAFTGADSDRVGVLGDVGRGTLFLDEIDELPQESQVGLLGVLQDREFKRLGSAKIEHAAFRLIAASNVDIERALSSGKIRQDLFHRISHVQIEIPPLRDRLEDLPLLATEFLSRLVERESILVSSLSAGALDLCYGHRWSGNVRELEAKIESAAYRASFMGRRMIVPEDLSLNVPKATKHGGESFYEKTENFKLELINQALIKSEGNQVKAADELKMDRSTMRRILARREQG